ncbi:MULTISPECIES: hypothetical protein [unclassified Bradyrhizobium]
MGKSTSASRKPADGLSRRTALAGLAALPLALPAAAAMPYPVFAATSTTAPAMPLDGSDQDLVDAAEGLMAAERSIDSLYEEHRRSGGEGEVDEREDCRALFEQQNEHIETLVTVSATSERGVGAKASIVRWAPLIGRYDAHQKIAVSLADDIARLGSDAVAGRLRPTIDAGVADLSREYELLLHAYVDQSVKWCAADSSSIAYEEADDEMSKISEQMEPLEELIKAIEIDKLDQDGTAKLRAVALKDLRYKLPSMHDDWEISDGNGDDLEMFWQILEFVGLADFARTIERRAKAAIERREAVVALT